MMRAVVVMHALDVRTCIIDVSIFMHLNLVGCNDVKQKTSNYS